MQAVENFKVPVENIVRLEAEIADVNKRVARLQRLGHKIEPVVIEVDRESPIFERQPAKPHKITGVVIPVPDRIFYMVHLITPGVPKIDGWEFVAALTHVEDVGTMVRLVPGAVVAEKELIVYRDAKPVCDHCNYNRRRNDTFVVRNPEGNLKQVGRNCLQSYTGIKNPQMLCAMAEILMTAHGLLTASEAGEWCGGNGVYYYAIEDYMPFVVASVRVNGWLSRKAILESGDDTKVSTADNAFGAMVDTHRREKPDFQVEGRDREIAKEIIEFCDEKFENVDVDALSDYESNLRVAMLGKVLYPKMSGIVASAYVFFQNDLARRAKASEWTEIAKASEFQGVEGGREVFKGLKVVGVNSWASNYGVTHFYQFVDGKRNVYVWFASRDQLLEMGKTYDMKATVKKHGEYKGVKQTVLTRGVVQEEVKNEGV